MATVDLTTGWEATAIAVVRSLIGDMDPTNYELTDERVFDLFLVCSNLVCLDVEFEEEYVIDLQGKCVTPEPSKDFVALVALKTACVYLTNKTTSSDAGCKVTMKDGPSTIMMDQTEALKVLRSSASSACSKYESAMFLFRVEGTLGKLGVAVVGPYGSACIDPRNSSSRENR